MAYKFEEPFIDNFLPGLLIEIFEKLVLAIHIEKEIPQVVVFRAEHKRNIPEFFIALKKNFGEATKVATISVSNWEASKISGSL